MIVEWLPYILSVSGSLIWYQVDINIMANISLKPRKGGLINVVATAF